MPARPGDISAFERMLHLRRIQLLKGLPPAYLAVMAEAVRERFFSKGTVLLREGEPVGAIHVVIEGSVDLRRRGRPMGLAQAGAAVGGLGLLARDNAGIEAMAKEDTYTLELDAETVRELLEDHFPIYHHLLREVSRQLLFLQAKAPRGEMPRGPRIEPPGAPSRREMNLVERILMLRQFTPFARASINALAELCRTVTEVRFPAGVSLWKEGDSARTVILLADGFVMTSRGDGGGPGRVGPGEGLGVVEAIAEAPRWFDAVTETPVVGLHGNIESLIDVFEDNFEMAMDYMAAFTRFILEGIERATDAQALPTFYGCAENVPGTDGMRGGGDALAVS
jgi:CRP-like cAMP-binding protein